MALARNMKIPSFLIIKPHRGPLLRKGMVIAVEPMVNAGVKETITLSDGWTVVTSDGRLCAHYRTQWHTDGPVKFSLHSKGGKRISGKTRCN